MAEALGALLGSSAPAAELVGRAALLYDAYSVLFLYCGSCSAEVYQERIRPRMIAADPAFSGRWLRDHEPIPPLLREVRAACSPEQLAPLTAAVRNNHLVHSSVADHLVPAGGSLLRRSRDDTTAPATPAERALCDRFFRVERMALCRNEFLAQFASRLAEVRCDLVNHPLDVPCPWPGLPHRSTAVITRMHRDSIAILSRLEESL
ncbi:hypothetical protein GCM10027088_50670 [Nocardia goodfellowii]